MSSSYWSKDATASISLDLAVDTGTGNSHKFEGYLGLKFDVTTDVGGWGGIGVGVESGVKLPFSYGITGGIGGGYEKEFGNSYAISKGSTSKLVMYFILKFYYVNFCFSSSRDE